MLSFNLSSKMTMFLNEVFRDALNKVNGCKDNKVIIKREIFKMDGILEFILYSPLSKVYSSLATYESTLKPVCK